DFCMHPGQRGLEVVADVLVELLILLVRDLRFRPRPESGGLVDLLLLVLRLLLLHEDRERNVVGVLAEDRAQARSGQQLFLLGPDVQDDIGAPRLLRDAFDRVLPVAGALPPNAIIGGGAGAAAEENDAIRDDERRVEADTELADELRVFGGVGREALEELARPRLRDRADLLDDLLTRQANAVVRYRDRVRGGIEIDVNAEVRVALEKRALRH